MPEAARPSLYDRLGGVYSIATVVDDFINRIMIDLETQTPTPWWTCSASSRAAWRDSSTRDRDGLLGYRRPAEVYGQVDGGIA